MNTVIEKAALHTRVVLDPVEVERLRWFQIHKYVASGLMDFVPAKLPFDPCVPHSTYFGLYNDHDEIQATARLVNGDYDLPMMKYHELYPLAQARLDAAKGTISEVSRLAVGTTTSPQASFMYLLREFLRFQVNNRQADLLVASIGDPLARILTRILGVPVEVLGPTISQYGDFVEDTNPVSIDMVDCMRKLQHREGKRYDFFREGLVIDLTDSAVDARSRTEALVA